MRNSDYKEEKKKEIMERCFECYCDNGLRDTGIKELGKYCNMTSANLYAYFDNVDDLILQSTAYCMAKVEDDFMALSPENPNDFAVYRRNPLLDGKKTRQKIPSDVSGLHSPEICRTGKTVL